MAPPLLRGDTGFSSRSRSRNFESYYDKPRRGIHVVFSLNYTRDSADRNTYNTDKVYFSTRPDRSTHFFVPSTCSWDVNDVVWETSSDHAFPIFLLREKFRLSVGISHFAPRTTIAPISRSSLSLSLCRGYTSTHPYSCMENALVYTTAALLNA